MITAKISDDSKDVYTIEDIYNLPDGRHAELINGEIYMMATPSRLHQGLIKEFTYLIEDYIRRKNGNCKIYPSPFAVFLNADETIYLEPDLSVICDESKLTEEGCMGSPDWVIEIVSPSSRQRDYVKKMLKYAAAGVREYWIVDYDKDCITVYDFHNETVEVYSFTDRVKAGIFEELEIDFSKIDLSLL